ncbi:hypothetical protein EVAR_33984_1 [Eumeta japonica]|uniref:Uncharacterized protein n=1 Tax=Eumeta variegata TaxID=151549 RepID=A0A4C1X3Q6_EUMVA|nr:hypothetical protein EVAR_33984_1 [Eumeta japonica]
MEKWAVGTLTHRVKLKAEVATSVIVDRGGKMVKGRNNKARRRDAPRTRDRLFDVVEIATDAWIRKKFRLWIQSPGAYIGVRVWLHGRLLETAFGLMASAVMLY